MKTSELSGVQLDWAVAQIERKEVNFECNLLFLSGPGFTYGDIFRPSADWECGGPIIEREGIDLKRVNDILWDAHSHNVAFYESGSTPLVAAMRCYVASKLGDEVQIPEELK